MARSFNGTTDRISVNNAKVFAPVAGGEAACSVAMWVKGGSVNGTPYGEGSANSQAWAVLVGTSNHLRLFIKDDPGTFTALDVTGTIAAFDGPWRHIVFAQDASRNYASYVDGVLDLSGTYTTGGSWATTVTARIGDLNRSSSESLFYNGSAAHVATWTRKLSAAEAKALAGGLLPSHLAPDHYWPLWGVDSPEPDIGNATRVTGTLTGTTAATGSPAGATILRPRFYAHTVKPAAVTTNKSDSDTATLTDAVQLAGPASTKSDSDIADLFDVNVTLAPAVTNTDTASVAAGVPSIALSSSDTATVAETQHAVAGGPNAADQEIFAASSTETLTANVASADTAAFAETPPAVKINNPNVISDSDTGTLTDLGTNASGGIGSSFHGVVLAFGNNALDATPTWTRLDDPAGVS